ncbi:SMP-30/gluconolactonase/LRE family protein [bacterium]
MQKKANHIISVLIVFLIIFMQTNAQNYLNEPESVVFDSAGNRYLISNKGNGNIIQMVDGVQTVFNSDQTSIRGLHILGDNLYAACNAGVVGFNLATGVKTVTIAISGQNFLNDITSDGTASLYVTDTGVGKIFKVDPGAGTSSTFVSGLSSPNGIYFDQNNNRLLVCYWKTNSPISAVNIADGSVTQAAATSLTNLDGITEDSQGRFYISSWGSNAVYRFENAFNGTPEQVSSGHSGPADIFFNQQTNILAVPNMNSNTVDFISFAPANLLNKPASVVFDTERNRYLISNTGDGRIIQMIDEDLSVFNSELTSTRGLHIMGDQLYAVSAEGIVGFDLPTGIRTVTIPIPELNILLDITSDGSETLYISDTMAGIIYEADPVTQSVTPLVSDISMPQGLLYDGNNNRLLVCHYLYNSPISAVNLTDNTVSTAVTTPFYNLYGLAQDNDGRIYVSCKENNNVYQYASDFHDAPEFVSNGFNEPADIFFNAQDNVLAVPNMGNNTVDFVEIESAVEPPPPPIVTENTFTVINTKDSGPGTLRQAIKEAMQNEGPDSVVFNIPTDDYNYRPATGVWTIKLESPLDMQPDSCTIIDGLTQAQNQGDTNPDGLEIELSGSNTTQYAFWGVSASNVYKGLVINRFTKAGIHLRSAWCTGNRIESCYIGTDAEGMNALPNNVGIEMTTGARKNIIGGKGRMNLISGNSQWGIVLTATYVSENEILYNQIGTDITGLTALGNGSGGVFVGYEAYGNIIGPANVISGTVNLDADLIGNGIMIQESTDNIIKGNYIGTDINGNEVVGNIGYGIAIIDSRRNLVGGSDTKDRNVIAGNGQAGILIQASSDSNDITNNYIGTDRDEILDLGNGGDGVLLNKGAQSNTIGPRNVIFNNGRDGVRVDGLLTLYNTITENSISNNTAEGINNVNGGNGEITPPEITEVSMRIAGYTTPNCVVEIFSDERDEGRLFEGDRTTVDNGSFSLIKVVSGPYVTATVTDQMGNTSEFSAVVTNVDDKETATTPDEFALFQNFPNPFNPITMIRYDLPKSDLVSLKVYDLLGKEIETLVNGEQSAGVYHIYWEPKGLSSGIYLYCLKTEEFVHTQKMIFQK